jgi:hypothetical protein
MPEKVYRLPLDLNRRTCSKKIVVRRNDYDTTVFAVQVFLNGIPYDITGLKPVFECIKPDGNRFRDDGSQYGNMLTIGRNLLSKSGNFTDTSSWLYSNNNAYKVDFDSDNQAFRLTVNSVATGMHFGLKTTRKPVFTPGDQYTFTICYLVSGGDKGGGWQFGVDNGLGLGGLTTLSNTNGEFKIVSYTGTFTDHMSNANTVYFSSTGLTAGTVIEIKWVMLTAGNKPAMDWSNAPEDGGAVHDVSAGKFEYTLPNELLMAQGEIPSAYFVLEKSDQALQNATDRMSTGDIPFTVIPDCSGT